MGHAKNAYTDMTKRIAKKTGMYDYQVRAILMAFIQETITDLARGKSVHLMALGKFWVKKMKPCRVWNPRKKEQFQVGTRYLPRFEYGGKAYAFIKQEATNNCEGAED
jgi:nucleoid DNA-binding protein